MFKARAYLTTNDGKNFAKYAILRQIQTQASSSQIKLFRKMVTLLFLMGFMTY